MSESINVEEAKQDHQKPPRNLGRIACEILAGTATELAVALPVAYLIGRADRFQGCFGGIVALGFILFIVPPVCGLACTFGVYLVGTRGNQTGSFLATLGCGFLGGIVMLVMLYVSLILSIVLTLDSSNVLVYGIEMIVQWGFRALTLLIPPIMATLGFNLTRRYKNTP